MNRCLHILKIAALPLAAVVLAPLLPVVAAMWLARWVHGEQNEPFVTVHGAGPVPVRCLRSRAIAERQRAGELLLGP